MTLLTLKAKWMASPSYVLYGKVARQIRSFIRLGRQQTWIYSGAERETGLPFKLAYSGSKQNKNYVFGMIFSGGGQERALGLFSAKDFFRKAEDESCDLAMIETRVSHEQTHFRIPIWIPQKLDVTGDIDHRESLRSLRRRFRKNAFRFELTQDKTKLKDFYTRLYVPFTVANHETEAFIHPFHEVAERAKKGELVLAYRNEECAGGNLIEYSGDEGRLSFIGVKPELVEEGAISAITWAAISRIKEKNLSAANLGDSRGFLKDGSFRFKAGLGCFVSSQDPAAAHCWTLKLLKKSPALENVLAAHPFISLDEEGSPWGIFFGAGETERKSICEGFKGTRSFSIGSEQSQVIPRSLTPEYEFA